MCNLGAKLRFFHHIYKLILSNFEVSPSKTIYYHWFQASLFPKRLKHLGDALFLLLHVWVNIEIKGCCDVGMTEQYAYSLVVAVAFYAACRKAVAQSVIFQPRNVKTLHQPMIVVAIGTWLCGLFFIGQHIEVCVYHRSMVRFTVIVPLSALMSDHFKPQISPIRKPVVRLI